jgi:hypothetical protein
MAGSRQVRCRCHPSAGTRVGSLLDKAAATGDQVLDLVKRDHLDDHLIPATTHHEFL